MTSSVVNAAAAALSAPVKKKRVLLVDTCRAQRDMRGETMRRLGMEVDCAADISEARCWWRPELYDLVLFHVETEVPHMYKFLDDIRAATPSQRIAFLVGKPEYLAPAPNGDGSSPEDTVAEKALPDAKSSFSQRKSVDGRETWGILEACRRISAVRSVVDARSRALRDRPLPRRDSVSPEPEPIAAALEIAAELEIDAALDREEMQ